MPSLVGSEMCIRDRGKHYQILAQDGEYSQLVVNEYGKGHSVYFAGLPYSPQNCRILLRAIYYAAGMPEEMKHYYVTNVDTEVTVFPETKRIAVINNADAEEKTDLYIKGHLIDSLTPVSYTHLTLPTIYSV